MTSRDEVACRVAERLGLKKAWSGGNYILGGPTKLWEALISAEQRVAELEDPGRVVDDKHGWVYDPGLALTNLRRAEAAEQRVAELEKALPKWISVKERLPELDTAVLCYGQGLHWIAHRRGHYATTAGFWEHAGDLLPFEMFTYWMPLQGKP